MHFICNAPIYGGWLWVVWLLPPCSCLKQDKICREIFSRICREITREIVDFRPNSREIVGNPSCDPNNRRIGVKITGANRDRTRSFGITARRYTDSAVSLGSEVEHLKKHIYCYRISFTLLKNHRNKRNS